MPAHGWITLRMPDEELSKVKEKAKKFELSFARMMLELVRLGLRHIKEINMSPKPAAKKKGNV